MILDCGHEPSAHGEHTTGYGEDIHGKKSCYACCAEHEREAMRVTGRATLYLSRAPDKTYKITDWPGHLLIHPYRVQHGKHNIARTRTDAWFSFEGTAWHGVSYGDNTMIIHCRRLKGKR